MKSRNKHFSASFCKSGSLLLAFLAVLWAQAPPRVQGTQRTVAYAQAKQATGLPGVRWGFYITYNPNSWASLQANARYLNYVSPWFYNLNAAAQITGKDQPQVSSLIRQVGAKSLPMLKNTPQYNDFSAILSDPGKQQSVVDQIDSLLSTQGYDGITIDFEGINAGDKSVLTAFMGRLYAALHPKGKLVAMAVAPKTRDITTGWAASYDYSALSAVTDYLLIMAYDYHFVNGDAGPIAPMNKLSDTADYTLSHVPAQKVIWGVGVYGLDWGEHGKSAEYRTWSEADALANTAGAQSGYDLPSQSPWVKYMRDGIQREVWYENRRSFEAKLDLISARGMAGFGIWRLGQEDPGIWESLKSKQKPAACSAVAAPDPSAKAVFFPQTGHTLGGPFLTYWQSHGGLPVFGYPLTEQFSEVSSTNGKTYTVQYFERNRFEYHPENKPPNDVLLGLLGVQITQDRIFPPTEDPTTGPDTVYFPQVRHQLAGPFLQYWQSRGGLAQFGFPISEPVLEKSDIDGNTYLVQYLERARFEYHSEYKGTNAEVLLGLLGLNVSPCR